MSLKFGTDGVRGVANTELTPELALALGRAAARIIGGDVWYLGRDTRRSGPLLAAAFAAGVSSSRVRCPIFRLKLIPLSTSCRASTFASSRASSALFRVVPTLVLR